MRFLGGSRAASGRGLVIAAVVLVMLLGVGVGEAVAGPAVFSNATPAPGATTVDTAVLVSVDYDDVAPLRRTWLKIDGIYVAHTNTVAPGDTTAGTLAANATLGEGTHQVQALVYNSSWKMSTYTWTFDVDLSAPPVLSDPAPSPDEPCETRQPSIAAGVAGDVASYEVYLDGALIPATMAGGTITADVPDALPNGSTHTARVVALGSNGMSVELEWDFYVQQFAQMPDTAGQDCEGCHTTFPSAHPMDDCMACHGEGSPLGMVVSAEYYISPEHSSDFLNDIPGGCIGCHGGTYSTVPAATHAPTHMAQADMLDCDPCHTADLLSEHYMRDDANGQPLTCATCHGSTNALVSGAIAAGDDECGTCHAGGPSSGHEALHDTERTDDCVDCHVGDNISTMHMADAAFTCDTCHAATDPNVIAAIVVGTKDCSACHVTQGIDYHLNMSVHYAPDSYEACGHCHHSWGSNPTKGPDVTRHAAGCTTCHNATTDLTGLTTACSNCHTEEATDFHTNTNVIHSPQDAGSLDCAECHGTTNVRELHVTWGCETCHYTYSCSECHTLHNAGSGPGLLTGLSCANCHSAQGSDYHVGFDSAHTFDAMDPGCAISGCHSDALVSEHDPYVGASGRYPAYEDACDLCHLNEDPARVPETATADCSTCHELHGDLAAAHTATQFSGYVDIVGAVNPDNPAADCEGCHGPVLATIHNGGTGGGLTVDCLMCHTSANLVELHIGGCSTCHSSGGPLETLGTWSGSCQQGECHATFHATAHSGHDMVDCGACHSHSDGFTPSVYNCGSCHTLNDTTPPTTTSNARDVYTEGALITLTPADTPVVGGSGVAATYYSLDGGVPTPGTSVFVSAPAAGTEQTHVLEFWSVDGAGNMEAANSVAFRITSIVDVASPTGTMAVKGGAAYTLVRGVSVDSAMSDAGTGVWQMRVDPGTGTFGAWIEYSATYAITLPAGEGTKTVRAEYKDYAGNIAQRTDTIVLDLNRPVTTSDAQASYTGDAVIHLSPTDSSSGVAHTYYILDGGAQTEGTTIAVSAPASGSQAHTLEYWSVDNAGRVEVRHYASFTLLAPSAQVGTIEFDPIYPNEIDWWNWTVTDSNGNTIASGDQSTWSVAVPVSPTAYTVEVVYLNGYFDEPFTEVSSALIDSPGKNVRIVFN